MQFPLAMDTMSRRLTSLPRPIAPSRRSAAGGTKADAISAFEAAMASEAPAQEYGLHLLERGRLDRVVTRGTEQAVSFEAGGSLARFLRRTQRPVMAQRTRAARTLARRLDPSDQRAMQRCGAVAVIPMFDAGVLIGIVVLGARQPSTLRSVDPTRVVELSQALGARLAVLRADPAPQTTTALHPVFAR